MNTRDKDWLWTLIFVNINEWKYEDHFDLINGSKMWILIKSASFFPRASVVLHQFHSVLCCNRIFINIFQRNILALYQIISAYLSREFLQNILWLFLNQILINLTFHLLHEFLLCDCIKPQDRSLWRLPSYFEQFWHRSPNRGLFTLLECSLIWLLPHKCQHFSLQSFLYEASHELEEAPNDPFGPVSSNQYQPSFLFQPLWVSPKRLPIWTNSFNLISDDVSTQLDSWGLHCWGQDAFWRGIFWDIEEFRGIEDFLLCSHMEQTSSFSECTHDLWEWLFHQPWILRWFERFHW